MPPKRVDFRTSGILAQRTVAIAQLLCDLSEDEARAVTIAALYISIGALLPTGATGADIPDALPVQ